MASREGAKAPFLNDYKLEFFWKRFPQTLTGGLKLKIGAPFYVYLYQTVVFVWPVLFGGLFTALTEYDYLQDNISCYLYGGIMALWLIFIHLLRLIWASQPHNITREINVLADDNEIDFTSCCDRVTFQFIFPAKTRIFHVFTHGILSGILCSLSFIHLLPSTVRMVYTQTAVIVVFCIFGWLSLCIANYSLMVQSPPETAIFRSMGNSDWTGLTRPFYVGIISMIGVLARHYSEWTEVHKVVYIIMAFLPLLWVIGLLPPLDALFSWLVEQLLVFALGGTYHASDFRIHLVFILSGVFLLPACFITNYVGLITYSALFGFVLSLDIFQIMNNMISGSLNCTKSTFIDIAKHIGLVVVTGAIASISSYFVGKATTAMFDTFGYIFILLFVVTKVMGDLQYVYIFTGLIRNPFYIKNTTTLSELKKFHVRMGYIGQVYNILLTYVCPLLLVAFLGLFLTTSHLDLIPFFTALGTIRALRRVWQDTWRSMIEVVLLCIVYWCKPNSRWWNTLGIGLQLLIIGFVYDRFNNLLQKATFMLTLYITAWTEPKQRHKATCPTLLLSLLFFPIVLSTLVLSVALSAPLLPLFCFPIFLVGFPRPKRSWPSPSAQSSSASEGAVFYQQLVPKVCHIMQEFIAKGSILHSTDFILVRYQDRFIIIQILEKGYKYCTVIARGLELQETSCHTVEATVVDDIFEGVFCKERTSSLGVNKSFLNTLTPLDCLVVETYSDAHNVLTGVIDQPDNIQRQSENFLKCLIWVLFNHDKGEKKSRFEEQRQFAQCFNEGQTSDTIGESEVIDLNSGSKDSLQDFLMDKPSSSATTVQVGNFNKPDRDWSDIEWSDDDDGDIDDSYEKQLKSPFDTTSSSPFGLPAQDTSKNKIDSGKRLATNNTLGNPFPAFGLPAQDIGTSKTGTLTTKFQGNAKVVPLENQTHDSTKLDPPYSWAKLLQSSKKRLSEIRTQFPEEWFHFLVKTSQFCNESLADDKGLYSLYKDVVMSCFGVVNVFGMHSSVLQAGPAHIHKVYSGNMPWSPELDMMEQDSELKQMVLQAFRYAFKLTYDEAVLGEVDSEEELLDTLNDFKQNWFIGVETDPGWNNAILQEKPNLFSIGFDKDKGTYTSHVLTKQDLVLYTGSLNSEAIYGQWASLAMELLYLTNDDEERYSIQAHPILLRNLTIQSADPPLGYAVYSTGPVHVPIGLL